MKNLYIYRRCFQAGSFVILIPVIVLALLSGLAISVIVGNTLADMQRAQTAADAGALAGAFAVRRERTALESADEQIKSDALDRVYQAARKAAEDNGFEHGVDSIQVNPTWPPVYTNETEAYYAEDPDYIRVTIRKPMEYPFFNGILGLLPTKFIGAAAVGRVGTDALFNTCPGLYIYGDAGKVLDLKFNSSFVINDGGIFIDYTGTGTALFGSASSSMTAQWIEQNITGGETASVTYYCTLPELHECTPENVSEERLPPTFPDLPANSCPSPSATLKTRCINGGLDFGVCTASACQASVGCTGVACLPPTCKKDCLTTTACPGLSGSPPSADLRAGEYCDGLTIVNTGTDAAPLLLKPSASIPSNIFNLNGSDMTILMSHVKAVTGGIADAEGTPYEGVILLSSPEDGLGNGALKVLADNKSTSSLKGDLRVYFNSIEVNYSTLVIDTFTEEGCGLLPGITTTVVQ